MKQQSNEHLINEQITFARVLVIGADGTQHGEMPIDQAQNLADEQNLDLVLVSPNSKNPVCKLMNYGKFKFELSKKQKEQKRNSKNPATKEVQISFGIDKHDLDTKIRNTRKFLISGDKVLVAMRLKGRENALGEYAIEKMQNFFDECSDVGTLTKPISRQNNNITMTISPSNN